LVVEPNEVLLYLLWWSTLLISSFHLLDKCVAGMKRGIPMDEDESIPPNYPPGYKWQPWNIDDIIKDLEKGKAVDLGEGNWD
jgi:hypothetical protein